MSRSPRAIAGGSGCNGGSNGCNAGVNLSPLSGDYGFSVMLPGFSGTGVKEPLLLTYNSRRRTETSELGRGWDAGFLSSLDEQATLTTIQDGDG